MALATTVNPQVTDAVTQVTVGNLGLGPSVPTVQSYLSATQSQGTIFASAVRRQEQLAIASLAATVKGTMGILALSGRRRPAPAPPAKEAPLRDLSEIDVKPVDKEAEMFKDCHVR